MSPGNARQGRVRLWRSYHDKRFLALGCVFSAELCMGWYDKDISSQRQEKMVRRYEKSNRVAKSRRGTPHINRFLWKIAKPSMQRRGFSDQTLIEHWPTIVGDNLAALSQPLRLSRKGMREGEAAVLTVKVEGAMALEIQHFAPQIIERLNGYYGYPAIGKLNIVQGPLYRRPAPHIPKPPSQEDVSHLSEQMEDIDSPRLRQALARLSLRVSPKRGE